MVFTVRIIIISWLVVFLVFCHHGWAKAQLNSCLDSSSPDFVCALTSGSRTDAELSLSDCGLQDDDIDDISECMTSVGRSDITLMSLRGNELTTLPVDFLDGVTNLEWLVLGLNNIQELPAGLLDDLPSLIRIGLRSNALTEVSPGLFDGISTLQVLVIGNNLLTSVSAGAFDGLDSIEQLDLRGNGLTTLPEGLFENLPATATLSLFNNPDLQCLPMTDATVILVEDPSSATDDFEENVLAGTCECPEDEDVCTDGNVCSSGDEGYVCSEVEINARAQSRKKAVIHKVNAREAVTAATAPSAVGASNSSIAPTGTDRNQLMPAKFGSAGLVVDKGRRQDTPVPLNPCLDSTDSDYRCNGIEVNTGTVIDLTNCGLTDADNDQLRECFETSGPVGDIVRINMNTNDFTTLPRDLVDGLTSLETLNLRISCELTCVPETDSSTRILLSPCSSDAINTLCD